MRRFVLVALPLAILVAAMPPTAGDRVGDRGRALSIGFQLQAGPVAPDRLAPSCIAVPVPPAGGTSSGTWTAAGDLADSGEAAACFRLTPRGDRLGLDGALRLVSERGTITLRFAGISVPSGAAPPEALLQRARVTTWEVTAATGSYRGLRARGGGDVVANLGRGDITVILQGVRMGR